MKPLVYDTISAIVYIKDAYSMPILEVINGILTNPEGPNTVFNPIGYPK